MTQKHKAAKRDILGEHSALWADQYALTMAQALFTNDKHEQVTSFHGYIRTNPFQGGYLLTAGQNILMDWLDHWCFDEEDIALLRRETVHNPKTGQDDPLYSEEFLEMLGDAKLEVSIEMMPEGELAFPDEPIIRVHGPVWQCLMVEAAILNTLNSQSLIATLASRLTEVAKGKPVLEFGLRRAQMLGGLEASRAAYIGGIAGTSNYLAKKHYGIPTTGTMAHALVMLYEDELQAFADYAKSMPGNTVFLVDTYNTLDGVKKAIELCQSKDITLKGIRLDSGDLAYLSKEARLLLDAAGFTDAKIAASNDLEEDTIKSLQDQGARIDIWALGTNLVTSKAQPALGGVYKLGAIFDQGLTAQDIEALRTDDPEALQGKMRGVIKLSEQTVKTSIPGDLDVLRFMKKDHLGNWMYDGDTIISRLQKSPLEKGKENEPYPYRLNRPVESVQKADETLCKVFNIGTHAYRPLKPCFKHGKRIREIEDVHTARKRAQQSLAKLDYSHKRLLNPHIYVVGLENTLFEARRQEILKIRRKGAKHNG